LQHIDGHALRRPWRYGDYVAKRQRLTAQQQATVDSAFDAAISNMDSHRLAAIVGPDWYQTPPATTGLQGTPFVPIYEYGARYDEKLAAMFGGQFLCDACIRDVSTLWICVPVERVDENYSIMHYFRT